MTSSKPNSFPNAITLGIRAPIYEFLCVGAGVCVEGGVHRKFLGLHSLYTICDPNHCNKLKLTYIS